MGFWFLIVLLVVMLIALWQLSLSVMRGTFLWQNMSLKDRYFGGFGGYQSVMFWVSLCLVFGFVLGVIVVTVRAIMGDWA